MIASGCVGVRQADLTVKFLAFDDTSATPVYLIECRANPEFRLVLDAWGGVGHVISGYATNGETSTAGGGETSTAGGGQFVVSALSRCGDQLRITHTAAPWFWVEFDPQQDRPAHQPVP